TTRLDQVEAMLAPNGPWATGNMFTLADAALTPTLFFAVNLLPAFGAKSPLEGRPKLTAWWGRVQERPRPRRCLVNRPLPWRRCSGEDRCSFPLKCGWRNVECGLLSLHSAFRRLHSAPCPAGARVYT